MMVEVIVIITIFIALGQKLSHPKVFSPEYVIYKKSFKSACEFNDANFDQYQPADKAA